MQSGLAAAKRRPCSHSLVPKFGAHAYQLHLADPSSPIIISNPAQVTLPLERFASRVAASLCNATGLGGEMVVASQREYEDRVRWGGEGVWRELCDCCVAAATLLCHCCTWLPGLLPLVSLCPTTSGHPAMP